jgi:thiamine kinase-like enzyme
LSVDILSKFLDRIPYCLFELAFIKKRFSLSSTNQSSNQISSNQSSSNQISSNQSSSSQFSQSQRNSKKSKSDLFNKDSANSKDLPKRSDRSSHTILKNDSEKEKLLFHLENEHFVSSKTAQVINYCNAIFMLSEHPSPAFPCCEILCSKKDQTYGKVEYLNYYVITIKDKKVYKYNICQILLNQDNTSAFQETFAKIIHSIIESIPFYLKYSANFCKMEKLNNAVAKSWVESNDEKNALLLKSFDYFIRGKYYRNTEFYMRRTEGYQHMKEILTLELYEIKKTCKEANDENLAKIVLSFFDVKDKEEEEKKKKIKEYYQSIRVKKIAEKIEIVESKFMEGASHIPTLVSHFLFIFQMLACLHLKYPHGDIRLRNCLFFKDGSAILIDFDFGPNENYPNTLV